MRNRVAREGLSVVVLAFACSWGATAARGQQPGDGPSGSIRDGFESPKVAWHREETDATVKLYAHERTRRAAHEGFQSEGFQFDAGVGGGFYYSYALPRVAVSGALKVSIYVRSNRAGAYFLGRVILPADVDPETRRPSFVQVQSTLYEASDRWQRLELADMLPEVERQARVIRASTRRRVSLEGAYLERLVVNLYGGEGETEVYLDELAIGPVAAEVAEAHAQKSRAGASRPRARTVADRPLGDAEPLPPLPSAAKVQFDRNRLTKDGFPWFFSGVRGLGLDPNRLKRAGFDTLFLPREADEETIGEAVRNGLLLVPELAGPTDRKALDPDQIVAEAATYPGRDAVAFWSTGQDLGREADLARRKATLKRVRETTLAIRKARPGGTAIATGTVVGMVPEYARLPENLDLVGVPSTGWATVQNPMESRAYLNQRRTLTARSNADALLWASLDASAPPIYQEAIWGRDRPPAWGVPRVQPEQIRMAAYYALAAGYRGLCFNADPDLTQGPGRMNLIELAFLNEELDLLEPILADADKTIQLLDTYPPDAPLALPPAVQGLNTSTQRVAIPKEVDAHGSIKAASFETKDRRGRLLMLADYSKYAQYQPPMAAINDLVITVPAANDAVAYEITPGGVSVRDARRVPGGLRVTLPDFGVSAIVLVTTNVELAAQITAAINRIRPMATALAIEQAELQKAWVEEIDAEINLLEHPQKDSAGLIAQAGELIKSAREKHASEDYLMAWEEARRAGRPLRHLMRYHFMAAYDYLVKSLNDEDLPCGPVARPGKEMPQSRLVAPIACPPLASWSTLPQAWKWSDDWIRRGKLGGNRLASGDFEFEELFDGRGWGDESYQNEDLRTQIQIIEGEGKGKGRSLLMTSKPRPGINIDTLPPFHDHPVVAVRSPAVKVGEREVYRISVMVFMADATAAGAGGLIVRDSIGGERLQFRMTSSAHDWHEVVFYRRVPADGTLSVLLGLAGYGTVKFDDLRIEPIEEQVDLAQYAASRPRRRPTPPATAPAGSPPSALTSTSSAAAEAARAASAARVRPFPIRQ